MSLSRRDFVQALACAPVAAATLPARAATTWPSQPIKIVLGYSTGGAADAVARALASAIEPALGQPVVLEYKPGAGGLIAADFVARAPADGYTLHLADTGAFTILPNLRKVNYDPVEDFTPLSYVGASGLVVLANNNVPANDIPSLVQLLKAKPGELVYSSSGIGTPHHLCGELFKQLAGVDVRHVPYRGAAPALTDLMGGQVQLSFATITSALPLIQAGRVKALGVTAAQRSIALPQVPTVAERGITGYDASAWFALVGPARLAPAVAERLQQALAAALQDRKLVATLEAMGVEGVSARSPAQLRQLISSELSKWGRVVRNANIKLES
jgi:tripartite-type tricarboxylate transporter receptor subunit TctC